MSLGKKLKELRAEREWTQQEVSDRAGINRGYYAQLEIDIVDNPSADVFLRLARAFNIHPEELYHAAGYIKEARIAYRYDETPEQILDNMKLQLRRLEKKLKGNDNAK